MAKKKGKSKKAKRAQTVKEQAAKAWDKFIAKQGDAIPSPQEAFEYAFAKGWKACNSQESHDKARKKK